MVLEFIGSIYEFIFILGGIAGVIMGFDRLIKSEEEESAKLQWIAFAGAVLVFASVILIVYNKQTITNYSALFGFLFFIAIIARPLKKIPFAFLAAIIIGLGIFYLVMSNAGEISILSNISLKWLVIGVIAIVVVIFIIGFFQESAMDGLLVILGWSPIILILSITLIVQGITLLLDWPDVDGILSYLPG